MATTIEEISGILTRLELSNEIHPDENIIKVHTPIPTKRFVNTRGENELNLYVRLDDMGDLGQVFTVFTGILFDTQRTKHRDAFLKLASLLQHYPEPVQFVYMSDARLYAQIEIPLADNKITPDQLAICFAMIKIVVEERYGILKTALETGELPGEMQRVLALSEGHPETTHL